MENSAATKWDSDPLTWPHQTLRIMAIVGLLLGVVAADQGVKSWVLQNLNEGDFVGLSPVTLGLGFRPVHAIPLVDIAVLGTQLALSCWVAWKLARGDGLVPIVMITVAVAGTWSNTVDRVVLAVDAPLSGEIINSITVPGSGFSAFNLADAFVLLGGVAWAVNNGLRHADHRSRRPPANSEPA